MPLYQEERVCILCVCGTTQLLASLCAAKSRESLFPDRKSVYILVVADLFYSYDHEHQFASAILDLSQFWQWHNTIFIDTKTADSILRSFSSPEKKADKLKQLIGISQADEIYLVRENIGAIGNLLIYAYSDAYKIAYGDTYGVVCTPEFFQNINPWQSSLKRKLFLKAKDILKNAFKQSIPLINFDEAVLTTPIDLSGSYLEDIKYSFVSLSIFKEIIKSASNFIKPEVTNYLSEKYQFLASPIDLLLLTTSGTVKVSSIEFESKISGYLELVKKYCPSGGKVMIKPHPRGSYLETVILVDRLSKDYQVFILDEKISHYPVEILVLFLNVNVIVSFLSFSSVVIALIGNYNQIYEHPRSFFAKIFSSQELDYVLNGQKVISESVKKIKHGWDGEKILWSRESNL